MKYKSNTYILKSTKISNNNQFNENFVKKLPEIYHLTNCQMLEYEQKLKVSIQMLNNHENLVDCFLVEINKETIKDLHEKIENSNMRMLTTVNLIDVQDRTYQVLNSSDFIANKFRYPTKEKHYFYLWLNIIPLGLFIISIISISAFFCKFKSKDDDSQRHEDTTYFTPIQRKPVQFTDNLKSTPNCLENNYPFLQNPNSITNMPTYENNRSDQNTVYSMEYETLDFVEQINKLSNVTQTSSQVPTDDSSQEQYFILQPKDVENVYENFVNSTISEYSELEYVENDRITSSSSNTFTIQQSSSTPQASSIIYLCQSSSYCTQPSLPPMLKNVYIHTPHGIMLQPIQVQNQSDQYFNHSNQYFNHSNQYFNHSNLPKPNDESPDTSNDESNVLLYYSITSD